MKGKPNGTYFCSCKPPVNVFGYKLFFPRSLEVRKAVVSYQRWVAGRAVLRYKNSEYNKDWGNCLEQTLIMLSLDPVTCLLLCWGSVGLCRWKKLGGWEEEEDRVSILYLFTAGQTLGRMVSSDPSYLYKSSAHCGTQVFTLTGV